jgi:chorismate dehydratase
MDPIRIACVRYLNTVVLIEGLAALDEVALIPTVPSRIADMVLANEADIGLVSLIDALRPTPSATPASSPALTLLPVGMIGCDGPTLTVRLFSSVPLDHITRIHADTDSHTSVALARVLMKDRFGIDPAILPFNAREHMPVWLSGGSNNSPNGGPNEGSEAGAWPEAMLLIGDKVVTDSPPAVRYPHQLDLGEAWHALTGLPFVYAAWACRAGEETSPRVLHAARLLDRQLRHNLTRIDWVITRRAGEHRWPLDLARQYLGRLLRFQIGPREQAGAAAFASRAHAMGITALPLPHWAALDPSTDPAIAPPVAASP